MDSDLETLENEDGAGERTQYVSRLPYARQRIQEDVMWGWMALIQVMQMPRL